MEEEESPEREFLVWWRQMAPGEWIVQFQDAHTGERFTARSLPELKAMLASAFRVKETGSGKEGEAIRDQADQRGF